MSTTSRPELEVRIEAATPVEFNALLREIHIQSKLSMGQIIAKTTIPRSTAYRFVKASNTTLPKRRTQVEQFAKACYLSTAATDKLLKIWDELSTNPVPEPLTEKDFADRQGFGLTQGLQSRIGEGELRDIRQRLHHLENRVGAASRPASPPPVLEPPVLKPPVLEPHAPERQGARHSGNRRGRLDRWFSKQEREERRLERDMLRLTAPQVRIFTTTRLNLAMLLGTALLFLVLEETPVHQTSWVALVLIGLNAIVVVRNPAIVRLRSLRSPKRLVASVVIGTSTVAPTLAATQLLYLAAGTGLLVFVAALIWLDVILWRDLRNWRGAGLIVIALGLGVFIQLVLDTTTLPPTATVLAGALVAAWALLELRVRIDDQRWW
ncbi:hypothetical protein ACIBJI_39985 [Nocardia sp. NPDC050408]|uniref:hypothetical protein n=1 Tax=Nocardia sp. NPDC050408 TaxID=3364319 RepID=UPI0037BD2C7B